MANIVPVYSTVAFVRVVSVMASPLRVRSVRKTGMVEGLYFDRFSLSTKSLQVCLIT